MLLGSLALGTCVRSLTELAKDTGIRIGRVNVDVGNTSCQVPFAPDYINKAEERGTIGRKRKSARR